MYSENCIVKDMEVLTEHFIPRRILHREGQLHAIRDDLKPLLKGESGRHVFIHGKPGTGKTCMSGYVARELHSHDPGIVKTYTNCWENPSRFRILYNILKDAGSSSLIHRKGTPTDEILEMITRSLSGRACVVILDEVDRIGNDRVLYDILTIPNSCLLMLANTPTALYGIDSRIRSRLASSDNVEFPPYKKGEIMDILSDRAEWGLVPGVIKAAQLEEIAKKSSGDCRVAIDTLRLAAEIAEREGNESITDKIIGKAIPAAGLFQKDSTSGMNPYEKIILKIVREKGKVESGTLFRKVKEAAKEGGMEEIAERTFRKYVNGLVKRSLLKTTGTGRWRSLSSHDTG